MRWIAPFLLAFVLGCGAAPKPEGPSAVPVGRVASARAVQAADRTASDDLKKRWPFDKPVFALYADAGGLLKTRLVGDLVGGVVTLAGSQLQPAQRKCIDDLTANVREIAAGADEEGGLVLVRFEPSASRSVRACVVAFRESSAEPATLPGAAEAWTMGREEVGALSEGLFVAGKRSLVERALAGRGGAGAALAGLGLVADEYVRWTFDKEGVVARGALAASEQRFRVDAEVDFEREEMARKVEEQLSAMRAMAGGEEAEVLAHMQRAVMVERKGSRVSASFELRETPEAQARELGALAALAVSSVRKYLPHAKQAEAKNTLGQIAKDLAVYWETEDIDPHAKKKLVSLPPVPKFVPRGTKYASTPADWKPWGAIRFEMEQPQYYQYEVKAAKDGESAEIIARGDLDGDGKTSEFKLRVTVRRSTNHLIVSPAIQEKDPEE